MSNIREAWKAKADESYVMEADDSTDNSLSSISKVSSAVDFRLGLVSKLQKPPPPHQKAVWINVTRVGFEQEWYRAKYVLHLHRRFNF